MNFPFYLWERPRAVFALQPPRAPGKTLVALLVQRGQNRQCTYILKKLIRKNFSANRAWTKNCRT